MAPVLEVATVEGNPEEYEERNVHAIYDAIATHFSLTRYKPWPIISTFLSSLPTGWVGLDSGTGNGKYLSLPLDRPGHICTIGLDRSRKLLEIARIPVDGANLREVMLGDVLDNPWRPGIFDYAISIATIHHLVTHERRRSAVKRLLQAVSPDHGRVLIYVWAIEQDELSKRKVPSQEAIPFTGVDVVVPWVLSKATSKTTESEQGEMKPQVFNRYYHMFAKGELKGLVNEAAQELGLHIGRKGESNRGVDIVQDGWERSNYYVELRLWENKVGGFNTQESGDIE